MKNFSHMKQWILDTTPQGPISVFPGPELPDTPNEFVMLTRYGGNGIDADGALDVLSWQIRVASPQNDFEAGEELADHYDFELMSMFSQNVNGVWVAQVERVGGAPSPLLTDNAERTHFVCSYRISVELALRN